MSIGAVQFSRSSVQVIQLSVIDLMYRKPNQYKYDFFALVFYLVRSVLPRPLVFSSTKNQVSGIKDYLNFSIQFRMTI